MRRCVACLFLLAGTLFLAGCGVNGFDGRKGSGVFVARLEETTGSGNELTRLTVRYLERVISEAADAEAAAVVVELDTSGGRLDYTQQMVEAISNAGDVPVIVYVAPQGAQAASAGTFIVMGSDVAAMAPQTRIGAAAPVDAFGRDIPGVLGEKVTNDAVALITGLAQEHGRNAKWAESAVREAEALNAREALERGVVEYVEPDLASVLEAADGDRVEPRGITLRTAGAAIVEKPLTFRERFGVPVYVPVAAAVLATITVVLAVFAARRMSRWRVSTGREGMIGEIGTVRRRVSSSPGGVVFVHGELWSAVTENPGETIEAGAEVEIVGFRRTSVVVRPVR